MAKKNYAFRYFVEPGSWPPPEKATRVATGVRVTDDNYGYADNLFVISIVKEDDGCEHYLMLDTRDQGPPTRQTLLDVRKMIDHYLENHS